MKKVEAIIRIEKLEAVKAKLFEHDVNGITMTQVLGCGKQKGHKNIYRGAVVDVTLLPKIKLEIVAADDKVDEIVSVIKESATTNAIGDGKIFVYTIDEIIRIRTGEVGESAIQ
jgi:nitrogen regulatory protein P-II 1